MPVVDVVTGLVTAVIELGPSWGVGRHAHLRVDALAHSAAGVVLADAEAFLHLIEALDAVVRRLGGVTDVGWLDRIATVCYTSSGRMTAQPVISVMLARASESPRPAPSGSSR